MLRFPSGQPVPLLGQGTWNMGDDRTRRRDELAALRLGLDLGMTLIDTAEMYGEGKAEELIAEAIAGRRTQVYLVSKVYPHNATRKGAVAACEQSLRRLGTDFLDLYLLHWRGAVPVAETLEAFAALHKAGKIRAYGVSNFDTADMEEAAEAPGGDAVATDQVLYNLSRRGIEWDLLPWCRERGVPIMAYSPVEQGRILGHAALQAVATRHGATPAQVALAWLLRNPDIIVIPKAGSGDHVRENHGALGLRLADQDLKELDRAFPPPHGPAALEML
ncbi:MAG: aldo/keto reductase [Gemmataceae bacterium]|nr:aldo/keto reductase [Gemmataceae bacterium]